MKFYPAEKCCNKMIRKTNNRNSYTRLKAAITTASTGGKRTTKKIIESNLFLR